MAPSRKLTPTYTKHKQSGRGRAVWTDAIGVRHFRMLPGRFESAESRKAFAKLATELTASPIGRSPIRTARSWWRFSLHT